MKKKIMNKIRQKIHKWEKIILKFIAIFTVCNMIEEQKVGAIFGPNSPKTAGKKPGQNVPIQFLLKIDFVFEFNPN